ncbi:UDP-N-acetylmuramoyl-L-alanyl-D-glutamate--2,6-diaminopimelate ligase [Thiomicrorhabdus arctica]|uniref:UDP-N-acetylmuramoyl-L-alanyl-D-glutamate--2, 6-diaminopimelate ligase n=1 Tax=Thiomicrorhabdus arctica TaxID=131540 RepID=UPI00036BD137|nr:UDP-N-acetylmuramoyl-L-alanyl-D-glutamate--2,6-diaminopimelate ligase [Thiomicrorhabdus arctica]
MKTVAQINVFLQSQSLTDMQRNDPLVLVNQLTLDSRKISQGDGFIALQGGRQHGLDYLQTMLTKQPGLVISDRALNQSEQDIMDAHNRVAMPLCTVLVLETLTERLADLAHWFYDQPSERINVVGVTGTNGKTSTVFYTAQLLSGLKQKVALIGTLGNGLFGALQTSQNTTPDVVSVHRLLAEFIELGAQWVLMEVSSHALELGRIKNVMFETVALTQITRDHMDFHGSVEHYRAAKQKLFTDYDSKHKVLNLNDAVGQSLAKSSQLNGLFGYVRNTPFQKVEGDLNHVMHLATLECTQLRLAPNGMTLNLRYQDQLLVVKVPLLGAFNAENVLCACSIVLSNELIHDDIHVLKALLENLQAVEGRMQQVSQSPSVIVDFAHTPDALEHVLLAVKHHLVHVAHDQTTRPGKLWVVFGCGGDRDQGKRPLMGCVAENIADTVMVTDDNPRFENAQQIRQQIFTGIKQPQSVLQQADRKQAIEKVLVSAQPEDIVVIAGKGHERYQDVQGLKIPFSDEQVVLDWVSHAQEHSTNGQ